LGVDLAAFGKSFGIRNHLRKHEDLGVEKGGVPRRNVVGSGKPWEWKPEDLAKLRVYMEALLKKHKKI
jgi:hypothetical protein